MNKKYLRNVINESYIQPKVSSKKAIVINLEYNNEEFSEVIPSSEIAEATEGLEPIRVKNGLTIYRGETYVVVVMGK